MSDRSVIPYVSPETTRRDQRDQRIQSWRRITRGVILGFFGVFVVANFPFPDCRFYIGHHPQWIISNDGNEVYVARNYIAIIAISRVPAAIIELILISLPIWGIERILIRRRQNRLTTTPPQ